MVDRQPAASAKNLVTVRRRESATGNRVTETEKRTGIVTANGNGNGKRKRKRTGTGTTEIMTVTVIATATATVTVIGTENETATVRGNEIVALGTIVGMTTTPDGHPVIMVVTVNGIGKVTPRETVVTETGTGMRHERQVQKGRTRNDVQEGMGRKTEAATMNLEKSAKQRTKSEVKKGQDTTQRHLHPRTRTARVGRKHQRRERYDSLTFPCNYRLLNPQFSLFGQLKEKIYYVHNTKFQNAMKIIPRPQDGGG